MIKKKSPRRRQYLQPLKRPRLREMKSLRRLLSQEGIENNKKTALVLVLTLVLEGERRKENLRKSLRKEDELTDQMEMKNKEVSWNGFKLIGKLH